MTARSGQGLARHPPVHRSRDRNSGVKLIFTEEELGRGAYGRVIEVDYAGTICAAKLVHPILLQYATKTDELGKIRNNYLRECNIWSTLRHPHIVQLLEVYHYCDGYSPLPIIIMEKMRLTLKSLVETYTHIPSNVKASILYDVCLGLKYLHNRNPPIVHRDLTPNNILLGADLEAKISDMGVAKVLQCNAKTMTKAPGTPDFMPPESLDDRLQYGLPLDIFSYGAVTLYTTTQQWPHPRSWVDNKPNGKSVHLSEVQRRQCYIDRMTPGAVELRPLVVSCLDDNPTRRPTIGEVSETIKKYKFKTEMSMGKPIEWWVSVSSEQPVQQQQQTNIPLEAQVEIQKKKISDLESELQIIKKFMKAKKITKSYEKYTKKHKPVEHRPALRQQSQPVRCSPSITGGSFVRRLSMNIHKYQRQCIQPIPKKLPHSSSYPCIHKLV